MQRWPRGFFAGTVAEDGSSRREKTDADGTFTEDKMAKYAILSDIHSNFEALSVVLEMCRELEVDHFVSLGDIVGYNADPVRCLNAVRDLDWVAMVRGNHDEYTASDDRAVEGFNQNARQAVLWTREQLTPAERAWLVRAPYRTSVPGCNMTLVHATLDSPEQWGYIFDVHHAVDNFSYQFTQLCFCGHSHVPVAFCKKPVVSGGARSVDEIPEWNILLDEEGTPVPEDFSRPEALQVEVLTGYKYLFNVGSIGQPRNRDPRASFAVFDNVERTVTRYRLPYDVATAQQKVLDAGLPERLALRLATGS